MKFGRLGLSGQLFILVGLVIALSLSLNTGLTLYNQQQSLRDATLERGQIIVNLVSDSLFNAVYGLDADRVDNFLDHLVAQEDVAFAQVYDAQSRIMGSAGEDQAPPADILENLISTASRQQQPAWQFEADQLWLAGPISVGSVQAGSLAIAISLRSLQEQLRTTVIQSGLFALLWIGLGLAGALLIARYITGPLRALTKAVEAVRRGDFNISLRPAGGRELRFLGRSFEQMTTDLQQMIAAEQQAKETLRNTVVEYAAFADTVQAGELDNQLVLEGNENDPLVRLGHNINSMVNNLRQQVTAEQEARTYLEATVSNYLGFVERVARGDLTARLTLNGDNDALTVLGRNLNTMVESLGDMTTQIREATANITAAAAEILTATTQQASGANEQSAAIAQTSTTLDEVKTVVEQAFAKAQAVAEQAQHARSSSQSGQQAVNETIQSMTDIKEKVEGIAENILALSEQTQQIGEIIATVNDIAAQSNLLALNASVEAARAGEHGKGFAVVAVEVRNLAEQSKQATAQVKTILNEIQRATNAAVMATEEGTKGVDAGVERTEQTGQSIRQLASSIAESASAAQQIVASAQQQTTGVEQIVLAMQNINQATVQNLASTRQTETSAQDLADVAQKLEAVMARYKLN